MEELRKNMCKIGKHKSWKRTYPIKGWGVRGAKAKKKIVSVGTISTFRHPLEQNGGYSEANSL